MRTKNDHRLSSVQKAIIHEGYIYRNTSHHISPFPRNINLIYNLIQHIVDCEIEITDRNKNMTRY